MMMFPSNSIPIFILVSFTILLHTPNVTADEELLLQVCRPDDNYTSGSQYQTNLNHLLTSLVSNGSRDGYFNTSIGVDPDIVYGLSQCRGDLSTEECNNCLITAAANVTKPCHNPKSATVRYQRCILRYSDSRFFSKKYTVVTTEPQGEDIPDVDVVPFPQNLGDLMSSLSLTAAESPSRYSYGDTKYAPNKTIHGMVECTRDLSPSGCESCLQHMISSIPDCCNATTGAKICTETCYIRYGLDPLDVAPLTPSGTNGRESLKILLIIVAIVTSAML